MNNKKSSFEKLIIGAVVGAAVGSVIGAAVAPKEGKKTRSSLFQKFKELAKAYGKVANVVEPQIEDTLVRKPRSIFNSILNSLTTKEEDVKKVPFEQDVHK